MKFEVGKKYWDVRYNGVPVVYACVAIHKGVPVFGLENLELSDLHSLVKYGEMCNGRAWAEYKEPVVHKGRILVTSDPSYGIDFVVDKSEGKYKVGDVCGRIDTRIVAIKPISYTES